MNDGELVVHTICTLRNYQKGATAMGRTFEDGELATLWECFRIALFPHLSADYLAKKIQEVEKADEKVPELVQQIADVARVHCEEEN